MEQVRLSLPQATAVGAKEPTANRLYELMFGAKNSVNSRRHSSCPAMKFSNVEEKPSPSAKTGVPSSPRRLRWMWQEFPSSSLNLGIKEIEHPSWAAISLEDRKSTRLNSSHANISYAVFCLKKKN